MIPDEILTTAKMAMRAFGQFQPMLFVDGSRRRIYMPLPYGETSDQRAAIMTQAGIELARRNNIGEVEKVYFVSEAWVSPARTPMIMPSEDPDRQEVLLFNLLDAQTNVEELEIYACVRNGRREIIELRRLPQPDGATVGGRLLPLDEESPVGLFEP